MFSTAQCKWFAVVILTFMLPACSSVRQVELSPDELQAQIRSGGIITTGESVRIILSSGERHNFVVSEITSELIFGEQTSIPIAEIVAVETRQFSMGRTAALAGSTLVAYQIMAAIAIAATVGL